MLDDHKTVELNKNSKGAEAKTPKTGGWRVGLGILVVVGLIVLGIWFWRSKTALVSVTKNEASPTSEIVSSQPVNYLPVISVDDSTNSTVGTKLQVVENGSLRDLTATEETQLQTDYERNLVFENDTLMARWLSYPFEPERVVDYKPYVKEKIHEGISKSAISLDGTKELIETSKYVDEGTPCEGECPPVFTGKIGEYVYDFNLGTLTKTELLSKAAALIPETNSYSFSGAVWDSAKGLLYYHPFRLDALGGMYVVDTIQNKLIAQYQRGPGVVWSEFNQKTLTYSTFDDNNHYQVYLLPNLDKVAYDLNLTDLVKASGQVNWATIVAHDATRQQLVFIVDQTDSEGTHYDLVSYDQKSKSLQVLISDNTFMSSDVFTSPGVYPPVVKDTNELFYLDYDNMQQKPSGPERLTMKEADNRLRLWQIDLTGKKMRLYESPTYYSLMGYVKK